MAIVATDNTQCRFNINAYRMVFVVNKENLLYKRQALHRARQVSSMGAHTPTFFAIQPNLNFSHAYHQQCLESLLSLCNTNNVWFMLLLGNESFATKSLNCFS
jgi:hypothetical protein